MPELSRISQVSWVQLNLNHRSPVYAFKDYCQLETPGHLHVDQQTQEHVGQQIENVLLMHDCWATDQVAYHLLRGLNA